MPQEDTGIYKLYSTYTSSDTGDELFALKLVNVDDGSSYGIWWNNGASEDEIKQWLYNMVFSSIKEFKENK